MKKIFLIVFVLFTLLSCEGQQQNANYGLVSPAQLEQVMESHKNLLLIDVRTPGEYAGGKIGNAQNIDVQSPAFLEKIKNLDKDSEYAVYCAVGKRSAYAVDKMKSLGFTKVYDLQGGYYAWMNQMKKR